MRASGWQHSSSLSAPNDAHDIIYFPAQTVQENIIYRTSRHVSYDNTITWATINEKPIAQRFNCSYNFFEYPDYDTIQGFLNVIRNVDERHPFLIPDYACSTSGCEVISSSPSLSSITIPMSYAGKKVDPVKRQGRVKQPWEITSPCLLVSSGSSYAIDISNITYGSDEITATFAGALPEGVSFIYYPLRRAALVGGSAGQSQYYKANMACNWEMQIPREYYPTRGGTEMFESDLPEAQDVIALTSTIPESTFAERQVRQVRKVNTLADQEYRRSYSVTYRASLHPENRWDYALKAVHAKHMQGATPLSGMPTDRVGNVVDNAIPSIDALQLNYEGYQFNCSFSYNERKVR